MQPPNVFPLAPPKTDEEILRNIGTMKEDLSVTDQEIARVILDFINGKEFPEKYVESNKGYIWTLLAMIITERAKQNARTAINEIVAENLEFAIKQKYITTNQVADCIENTIKDATFAYNTDTSKTFPLLKHVLKNLIETTNNYVLIADENAIEAMMEKLRKFRNNEITIRNVLLGEPAE